MVSVGTSLVAQWLGLCACPAGGTGWILGGGTKIPQAMGRLSLSATTAEAGVLQ